MRQFGIDHHGMARQERQPNRRVQGSHSSYRRQGPRPPVRIVFVSGALELPPSGTFSAKSTAERASRSFCRGKLSKTKGNMALGRDHPGPRLESPAFDPSVAPPKIVAEMICRRRQMPIAGKRRRNSPIAKNASAQRTTLLATEGKHCLCEVRRAAIDQLSQTDQFGPTHRLSARRHAQANTANCTHYDDQSQRSSSASDQQHAIVRVIDAVSSNIFSRTSFGENNSCVC